MRIERKRYVVMRKNRTEVWCGLAKHFSFRPISEIRDVSVKTYRSEAQARSGCSSWDRDFEVVPVIETIATEEALTLEELREMDDEPVWCKWLLPEDRAIEQGKWFIVISGDKAGLEIKRPAEYGCHFCKIDDYGKTWLAYRRPPEGDEDA